MSSGSEKEPIFGSAHSGGGESAPIYQERTKTKQMVSYALWLENICVLRRQAQYFLW